MTKRRQHDTARDIFLGHSHALHLDCSRAAVAVDIMADREIGY